jgi:hypothetical protein
LVERQPREGFDAAHGGALARACEHGRMLRAAPLEVTVDGRVVRVTNPDRVLFPELGVTKADIVRYVLESATS